LDQVPRNSRLYGPASHADHVHVIVFDSLARGEAIVNQGSPDAANLVRAHACPYSAAADGHTALCMAPGNSLSEWNYKIRVIVIRVVCRGAEIDDVTAVCA
jgi:hypothetical protein